jgi:SAM-dependent methyltransferase/chorismate mutase
MLGILDLKKIGERLKKTDRFLLDILKVRIGSKGLSDRVAENKQKASPDGVYDKKRPEIENQRIEQMKRWADNVGIDPNFAASFLYLIISESCRRQDEVMICGIRDKEKKKKFDESNPDHVFLFQREQLLMLTATVAESYERHYGKGFLGSEHYFSFERKMLHALIAEEQQPESLAIDLGCATGIMSREIAHKFGRVIGYDVSPDMIRVASEITAQKGLSNVEFRTADLEDGIDLPENSVSLAIMNMGTASEIKNIQQVIEDLKKTLQPDGKFLFSFYNSGSLLAKIGFVPWPMPLAAHIDEERRCLEVQSGGEVYLLYARPRSVHEVTELFAGLEIETLQTFPTLASVIPNIIIEDEDGEGILRSKDEVKKTIKKIDAHLADSPLNCGTYIVITGGKSTQ